MSYIVGKKWCYSSIGGGGSFKLNMHVRISLQIRRTSDKLLFRGNINAQKGVFFTLHRGCISTTNTTKTMFSCIVVA